MELYCTPEKWWRIYQNPDLLEGRKLEQRYSQRWTFARCYDWTERRNFVISYMGRTSHIQYDVGISACFFSSSVEILVILFSQFEHPFCRDGICRTVKRIRQRRDLATMRGTYAKSLGGSSRAYSKLMQPSLHPVTVNPFHRPGQRALPVIRMPNLYNGFTILIMAKVV